MPETAVVVTVPAAEPVVSAFRRAHTDDGADGMPAHVTLVYPFADSLQLGSGMVAELGEELARFPSFTLGFRRLDRFGGSPSVLYTVPEPGDVLIRLTDALSSRFGFLPYGGVHRDVVPHLTIAISDDPALLDAIEADVARSLPITGVVDTVQVWEHDPAGWRLLHRIALRPE
jgi:2'-5' RNA ligase